MNADFSALGRCLGVLLHPTSLPEGTLGASAYRFVDLLENAGCRLWQVLPIGPTHADRSPYASLSAFAGNIELIDSAWLRKRGWLHNTSSKVAKTVLLNEAFKGFQACSREEERRDFSNFCESQQHWLEGFSYYMALRRNQNDTCWWHWPQALKSPASARQWPPGKSLAERVRFEHRRQRVRFEQFIFFQQWRELKAYAEHKGIALVGDLPFFVDRDSADVWSQQEQYLLDTEGNPLVVAGVPPDYFSETGQHWGNPHYDWSYLQNTQFAWWRQRLAHQLTLQDLVRMDHFRGFCAVWQIPATAETAIEGHWAPVPGDALLSDFEADGRINHLIAEDLGQITEEVEALRRKFAIPGIRVIQFAFDGKDDNPHLPCNHEVTSVVYSGTHDNDTTLGWWRSLEGDLQREILEKTGLDDADMPWPLLRYAAESRAQVAVFPFQDLLSLGSEARMNTPGTVGDNWQWRFQWRQVPHNLSKKIQALARDTNRQPDE